MKASNKLKSKAIFLFLFVNSVYINDKYEKIYNPLKDCYGS